MSHNDSRCVSCSLNVSNGQVSFETFRPAFDDQVALSLANRWATV